MTSNHGQTLQNFFPSEEGTYFGLSEDLDNTFAAREVEDEGTYFGLKGLSNMQSQEPP